MTARSRASWLGLFAAAFLLRAAFLRGFLRAVRGAARRFVALRFTRRTVFLPFFALDFFFFFFAAMPEMMRLRTLAQQAQSGVGVEEWQTGGGLVAGLLTALLVWVRRRRGKGWRLRARFSFRSPPSEASSEATPSTEPPPYPDEPEADTKPRKARRRD